MDRIAGHRSVQALRMVHQFTVDISFHCGFDFMDVGQDGLNSGLFQIVVGTLAHAACHQNLAIANGLQHAHVAAFGYRPRPMCKAGLIVRLVGELIMGGFQERLSKGDFPINDSEYLIVHGASKMSADGLMIICYNSYFH